VLCLAACSKDARKALVCAESLVEARPDSARLVLEQIPQQSLHSQRMRARYGLLVTTADIRLRRMVDSDSLIRPAYDYFHRFGSPERRMYAAFYRGIVKQNRGESVEASYLFYESAALAERLGNYHYQGLSFEHLTALYTNNYDSRSAYESARKAIAAFDKGSETLSADFSRVDMARLLFNLGERARARAIVDSLLACPSVKDSGLRYYLYLQKANDAFRSEQYAEAGSFFADAEGCGYPLDIASLANVAVVKEMLGQQAEADRCLDKVRQQLTSPLDSSVFYDCSADIYQHRGDAHRAYQEKLNAYVIQNRVVSSLLDRSITHSQRTYFESQYVSERSKKWMVVLICVLIVVSLLGVILVALIILRRRKRQIVEEMEKVEGINQDLMLLQEKQKGAGAVLSSLVQDKIRVMQQLTDTYFSWTDEAMFFREQTQGKALKEDVVAEFRSALRTLRNDDYFIPSIEKTLDISSQDLIARLRSTFSEGSEHKMKEMDFKMLTLLFAGFTPKSISFIMDMTEESVRTRKSRYKKLFLSMGEAGSDFAARLV